MLSANAKGAAAKHADSPLRDAKVRMAYASKFRAPRQIPTCGHPERMVQSRGQCSGCNNRDRNRMRLGVTPVMFREMLMQQDWHCLICTIEVDLSSALDHNHATGVVRGILCDRCNWLLGHAAEQPEMLRAAADYIEYHADMKARTA
jgi:hypothetical protein